MKKIDEGMSPWVLRLIALAVVLACLAAIALLALTNNEPFMPGLG
jgi:hypothetical protein